MSVEKQQISRFQCSINQIITGDTKWHKDVTVKALKS